MDITRKSQTRIKRIKESQLVIIDDLMYAAMDPREANLFFQLINDLYNNSSIILTSNRSPKEWTELLGDVGVATAVAEAVTPPKTRKVEMQTWDNEQVKVFLNVSKDSPYYPIYLTAINTGMRRGEVLGLRWQDIDFDNNIVYVRQSLQEVKNVGLTFKEPKSGKSRSITITPSLVKELKKIYKQQLENKLSFGQEYHDLDLVFSQINGKPIQPTEMARNYRKMVDKSGLPYIRFHDLRHTHATLLLQKGVHPKVVSERLGHSTIGITMDTYTHVLPNMQKEAAHLLEQLIK